MNRSLFILAIMFSTWVNVQVPYVKERNHAVLNNWIFKKGIIYNAQKTDFNDQNWEAVSIPHTYSMDAINGVGYYSGEVWYRTTLEVPKSMVGERIFIRFEGVGQEAEVFVNSEKIGKHVGGYSAFCYEITDDVYFNQQNTIAVNVTNAPNFKRIPVYDNLFNHYGGIYRPVEVFSTPAVNMFTFYYASSGVFVETKTMYPEKTILEIRTHLSSIQPYFMM